MTDPLVTALRQRREQLGLTQTMLARRLGMFPQNVHAIEHAGNPRLSTLRAMAESLGCDLVLTPKPNVRVSLPGGIWPAP